MDSLNQVIEINELFALYHPLLTPKQRVMIKYYYEDDYSLKEIAELESISRNAVHDQLKRTVKKLYDFEAKLKLNKKAKQRRKIVDKIKISTDKSDVSAWIKELEEVE